MLGYVTVGVKDMEKAKAFYGELLADVGATLKIDMGRIAFYGAEDGGPMVAICEPFNEQDPSPGNGNMLAFTQNSKEDVDKMYRKALSLGASCDGEPGQRIEDIFYGGYVRDPDGNKMTFCIFG